MMPTLLHTGEAPVQENLRSRIMVMGPAAHGIAAALVRMQSNSEIHSSLTIPALSRLDSIENITVLAGPQSSPSISALPGVASVITEPYNPLEIANSLGIEVRDSRSQTQHENNQGRRSEDKTADPEIHGEVEDTSADNLEEDERPLALRMVSALVNFIPGLTPLLSMLYKNLALTVLSALFIAFVSYGIMIAYFLTSGDWSSPLQLQRGHELVIKADKCYNQSRN